MRRVLLLLILSAMGCRSCKNDHPYVPYSIDGEIGSQEGDAAQPLGEDRDAASFAEIPAEKAPVGTLRWKLGGTDLAAPPGTAFVLGTVRDLDGDGTADGIAIVRRFDDTTDAGAVVFFKNGGAPQILVPSRVGASNCPLTQRLGIVGPHSAFVELGLGCPAQSSKEPSRAIAVMSFGGGARPSGAGGASSPPLPRVQLEAGILDPSGSAKLAIEPDGLDRDGDGFEDVTLAFTIEGGEAPFEPGPRTKAKVIWFAKPAGLSREPDEPDASFRAAASTLAFRAKSTKDAPSVPPAARQVRALYRALCSEGGSARLVRPAGDALVSCGTSRGLEDAALAEVRAAVTNGGTLLAIGILDRAQKFPATKTAARTTEAAGWITTAAPITNASDSPRQVAAVPAFERTKTPAFGSLAFEAGGKLLVRTANGVVRVDPTTGDETDASDVKPWDLAITSPGGTHRLLEIYNACDGVALHATLGPGTEQDVIDVALPIAPPLGMSRCATAKGEPASVVALGWGAAGLEAVVAGEPMLITDAGRASALAQPSDLHGYGMPHSPDGRALVVPTSLGIWTRGGKTRLLRASALDGTYAEQRDCAISDDGGRVACVRAGRAWVASFPVP